MMAYLFEFTLCVSIDKFLLFLVEVVVVVAIVVVEGMSSRSISLSAFNLIKGMM